MRTLNIVGCGRVGQTLGRLLQVSGLCQVQDLKGGAGSVDAAARFIGAGRGVASLDQMRPADLWLLAVPDTAIGQVAGELAASLSQRGVQTQGPAPIAFHCSGFHGAAVLAPLRAQGFRLASAHPVLSFADPAVAAGRFEGVPCGLEGDEAALQVLEPLLSAVGAVCFAVQTERKPLYHAAAVFANNFTVVLQALAREAWEAAGVPDALAARIQTTLLHATTENVLHLGPRAITGPAARGDTQVVQQQGAEVQRWHPEAGALYQELSRLARRLALHHSTLPPPSGKGAGEGQG